MIEYVSQIVLSKYPDKYEVSVTELELATNVMLIKLVIQEK
jgi:hypothetical protein